MSDYTSQFAGTDIDARLAKVPQLENGLAQKQDTLQSGVNIKTINNETILGPGNIVVQGGEAGVGFDDVTTQQDGTIVITLTNGDTITIDLNHNHPQYAKYVYCSSQAAYDAIVNKENDTLYLILES